MRIGKCFKCKKIYHWDANALYYLIECPKCGGILKRTIISEATELVELPSPPYKKAGTNEQ